jgi:ribosomal protein L29
MSKAKEHRDQSVDELKAILDDKRKELFQHINQRSQEKKFEKPHLIEQTRREIARILTVLTEKEMKATR